MRFLISLWRMVGNAPLGQLSASSIVKFSLQTHFEGMRSDSQPYLRLNASWNSLLFNEKLYSSRGNVVSQLEDPLSLASSAALDRWSGSLRLEAFSASCFLLSDFTLRLICFCSVMVSSLSLYCQSRMSLVIGPQMSLEAWRWDGDVRSGIARPPRRQGSARSSRSTSEMADLPVRAGMNLFLMMSSTGARRSPVPGVVRIE